MRRVAKPILLALLATLLLAPAWLLGTTAGLRAAASIGERATGGALVIEDVEGTLAGDFSVHRLAYTASAATVTLDRAALNLRLSRLVLGRIQAEWLKAGTLAVTTRDAPAPAPDDGLPLTVTMPLRLAVEDGHLDAFELRRERGDPPWPVRDIQFGARWRDEWIVIGTLQATAPGVGVVRARGRLAIVEDRLELREVEAQGPGALQAEGALALGSGASSALAFRWRDAYPTQLGGVFGSARGEGRLDGPWGDYRWRLQGPVQYDALHGELDARGRGSLAGITIDASTLAALGGRVSGSGRIDWAPQLRTDLALAWTGLDPARAWPQWPGVLNGEARLQARWRGTSSAIEFDASLRESQLRGYPLALQAVGRTENGAVSLKSLEARSGKSTLAARGQLLPELGVRGELRSDDLRALWAGLSGEAQATASASGPWAAPRIVVNGAATNVALGALRIARATVDADVDLAARGRSRAAVKVAELSAGAVQLKALEVSGEGTRASHRARASVQGLDGIAQLGLEGRLAGDNAWRGRLVDARVSPPQGAAWALEEPASLAFARGRFALEPTCLSSQASRACAELGLSGAEQRVAFRLRDFDLAHLRHWLPPEWSIVGGMSGTAAMRVAKGELREVRAALAAAPGSVEAGGVKLEYGPGSLDVGPDGDRVHARLQLRPAGGAIDADVWIAPGGELLDRPMLGDLRLKLPDLSWLPVLSPEIASAQGSLTADLHVSGTPRAPSLDGRLDLAGGRVQLATPGIELTGLTASFQRGRDAPLLLHAKARSGDGELEVEGEFTTLQPKLAGTVTIKGQDVLGLNRGDIRAWLSPDLTLTLDGATARLTGELAVPRAEITPREIERGGVAPSGDQVLIEREEDVPANRGMRVSSEVRIALGDQVSFDGLGLKTKLTGAITAIDDPDHPTRGRGELRLDGGKYQAYGQDLLIETGRLIFSGGPITDPAIDIRAVRTPREDLKVGLRARGTLDQPEFSLFSEPAMSQEEQLSWLVLGRSLSTTLSTSQQSQLSGAAVSLGLTGGDYLAGKLAPRLGLDEVSLGSKPGETADLARFTIGKYLSPKLFVSYGYGLFQPGHFFRLQYELGRRFKLVGESGVQQGGDILYTIER